MASVVVRAEQADWEQKIQEQTKEVGNDFSEEVMAKPRHRQGRKFPLQGNQGAVF